MTMAVTNSTIVMNQETPPQGRPKNRGSISSLPQESKRTPEPTETLIQLLTGSFPIGRPRRESDQSVLFSIGIKKEWSIPLLPYMHSWCAQRRNSL